MTWSPIYWLLAAIPALIALYFLKLRRQDQVVSSTLLWRRAIEDLHVNAPFQKLRRSLLLLLQLLVLIGLILALWRPRSEETDASDVRNLVILVDQSASMLAAEGDGTRFDLAKARALELVDAIEPGERMAVLAFAASARTIEPITGDAAALRKAIESIEPTDAPTDLTRALSVAGSLAESLPGGEIRVIGDGCYSDLASVPDEVKRVKVEFVAVGDAAPNVCVTELDVRQTFEIDRRAEILAIVENTGAEIWSGTVSYFLEDELEDAREVTIEPGKREPLVFESAPGAEGIARIEIDVDDALDVDNRAWVSLAAVKPTRTLFVGEPNTWVELVLESSPSLDYRRIDLAQFQALTSTVGGEDWAQQLQADVLIFDRAAPPGRVELPALFIGCLPAGVDGQTGGEPSASQPSDSLGARGTEGGGESEKHEDVAATSAAKKTAVEFPTIIDWDRSHPVNRFVVYTDLAIENSLVLHRERGFRPLVESDEGALIAWRTDRSPGAAPVSSVVIGFDILVTNWPLGHHSFPVFFANTVDWLASNTSGGAATRFRTGERVVYRPEDPGDPAWETARVRLPSSAVVAPTRDARGRLVVTAASEAGVYDVLVDDEVRARLPVSVLDTKESRLTPQEKVSFGDYEVVVAKGVGETIREYWKWLALGALAFVMIEWYVYNRRLGY